MNIPAIGVGVVYTPAMDSWIQAGVDMIDVIEVEPQTHWVRSSNSSDHLDSYTLNFEAFDTIASFEKPTIFHSVGMPIGGSSIQLESQLVPLSESIAHLNPLWLSEHLNFNYVPPPYNFNTNFLLPPLQTARSITTIHKNINQIRKEIDLPFLFEIGANYLTPNSSELLDSTFFSEVAEQADCGILLDLHNVWANARNGRENIDSLINNLPLERVHEIHLAGGRMHKDYWIDAHSGLVQNELWEIAHQVVPLLPNLAAINFEIVPGYISSQNISESDFCNELEKMRSLWEARGTQNRQPRIPSQNDTKQSLVLLSEQPETELLEWQNQLGSLVIGHNATTDNFTETASDNGIGIYQDLIKSVRGGLLVSALPITTRYFRLHIGEKKFMSVIEDFWLATTPHPYASDEGLSFVSYLNNNPQLCCQKNQENKQLKAIAKYESSLIQEAISGVASTYTPDEDTITIIQSLANI